MSFADLKAKASDMSSLVGAAGSTKEKKSYGDDRMWKPSVDKAGNGYAVIRFLPTVEGDDLPWAKFMFYNSNEQISRNCFRSIVRHQISKTAYLEPAVNS